MQRPSRCDAAHALRLASDVAPLTRHQPLELLRPSRRYMPVPDSLLAASQAENQAHHTLDDRQQKYGGMQTPSTPVTDLKSIGEGRGTVLSLKLDRVSDSVSGQTVVDPKGYLTDLNSMRITSGTPGVTVPFCPQHRCRSHRAVSGRTFFCAVHCRAFVQTRRSATSRRRVCCSNPSSRPTPSTHLVPSCPCRPLDRGTCGTLHSWHLWHKPTTRARR